MAAAAVALATTVPSRTSRSATTTSRSERGAAGALLAIERFVPRFRYSQDEVTRWAAAWLDEGRASASRRLLKVFASAGVATRGSVAPIEEVFAPPDFETSNRRYAEEARAAGTDLTRRLLEGADVHPAEVGLLVSVSCTGFMIPALDAYVADALGMGPSLTRLPLTESGCAGGVVGLARALDFLAARPSACAVVLAVELSSLTFQRWDRSPANVVSTAIFGDGGAAALLVGPRHPLAGRARARLSDPASRFFPGTTHLMGFELRNEGLQIVLDRGLAAFVRREIVPAVEGFLGPLGLQRGEIDHWVLHPGGRRVIEALAESLGLTPEHLAPTERVLREHGNMSSVTVLYVLDELLRAGQPAPGSLGVLGAFGPGFCAELALLEVA